MGEVRAPDPPEGNYQVVDVDGKVLKANAAPKRKKSFVEKVGGAIFGMGGAIPTSQRGSVRPHWGKVVKHNGWLLKRTWRLVLRAIVLTQVLTSPFTICRFPSCRVPDISHVSLR